ncbi:phage holin family protein [Vibrio sp. ABG19]|uniref:phage holin family protein n=1 Tax=Vibrio sp. ABG19 TaxID=2817385 RepID=UPI00249E7146|nr:phage holin family protein [Vibrio sp. ABG19]WGY45238.1 phage holin family protein [Vibrio sp. ABG19]
MPLKDPENWNYFEIIGLALMAMWGGLVTYLLDIRKNNRKFRWLDAFMQVVVSGFAGMLCMLAAMYYEWPITLMGFACGISGLAGSRALAVFEKKFLSTIS